jgi:signal transduction histidine kinase
MNNRQISGTNSSRSSSLTTHALLVATLIAAVTHSLALIFQWGGPNWELIRGDLLILPASLFAATLCWQISGPLEPPQRFVWRLFALGVACSFLGNLTWACLELVFKIDPFPSLADLFYNAMPILFLFALKALSPGGSNRLESVKTMLDTIVIVTASVIVAWQVFLAQLVTGANDTTSLIVGVSAPSLELLVVVLLLLPGLGRRITHPGPHFGLLWLGMGMVLIADTLFSLEGVNQTYQTGQLTDLFYTWGYVAFALAAHARQHVQAQPVLIQPVLIQPVLVQPVQTQHATLNINERLERLLPLLPYLAALTGLIGLVRQFGRDDLTALGVLIGNLVLSGLVACRQAISLLENMHLNQQLRQLNSGLTERISDREIALEQSKERLIAADRLASLGQLTGGIAHEVNTPLAAAMNFLHQANALTDEYKNSINAPTVTQEDHLEIANELKDNISRAQNTLERLGEFVRNIRNQGRSLGAGAISFNLVSVVRETVGMLEFEARKVNVRVQFESASNNMTIHGEPGRIAQIVQNLVGNAIHACESRRSPQGSQVTVRLSRRLTGQSEGMGVPVLSERVLLSVQDNGSGIPPEVLPRIFEPLYSTKEIGRGTGLGLSIIKDIITGHLGGEITLETTVGQGTTFTVSFPVAHAPQMELAGVRNFEPSRNTVIIGDAG